MSATSVGQIGLDLVVNKGSFDRQMSGIEKTAKKAGMVLAAAFSVKKMVDFGKSCIELGSNLAEVQNVVDVTFPRMTAKMDEFAKKAMTTSGLSETMAKKYAGTFGAMAKSFGFTEQAAYDMGTGLTSLAGDVASFYNISQDEAYTKLKSVFSGETETLKELGVVMTQSALDAYALANGFGKTTKSMSEAEKVALRYQFVQSKLAAASGDFARTSDSWANQTRILRLQIESIKATIGQGLINLFTPILRVVNALIGRIATLANSFKAFTELITGKKSGGSQIAAAGKIANEASVGFSNAAGSANQMSAASKKVASSAKKAAKEMKALMGFDQISKLTAPDDSDTGSDGDSSTPSSIGDVGSSAGDAVDYGTLAQGNNVLEEMSGKLPDFFKPFKDAWDREGKNTAESVKRMFKNIRDLIGSIGKSFATVWENGTGSKILETILQIWQGIFDTIGNVAKRLNDAWNKAGVGTRIVQHIADIIQTVLEFVRNIAKDTAEWANNLNFTPLLESIDKLLKSMKPVIEKIGRFLEDIYKKYVLPCCKKLIEDWLPKIIDKITALMDFLGKHEGLVRTFGTVLLAAFAATAIRNRITKIIDKISGAKGLTEALKGGKTGLNLVKTALEQAGQAGTTAGAQFSTLTGFVSALAVQLGVLVAAIEGSRILAKFFEFLDGGNGILTEFGAGLNDVNGYLTKIGSISNETAGEIWNLKESLETANMSEEDMAAATDKIVEAYKDAGVSADELQRALDRTHATGAITNETYDRMTASLAKYSDQMKSSINEISFAGDESIQTYAEVQKVVEDTLYDMVYVNNEGSTSWQALSDKLFETANSCTNAQEYLEALKGITKDYNLDLNEVITALGEKFPDAVTKQQESTAIISTTMDTSGKVIGKVADYANETSKAIKGTGKTMEDFGKKTEKTSETTRGTVHEMKKNVTGDMQEMKTTAQTVNKDIAKDSQEQWGSSSGSVSDNLDVMEADSRKVMSNVKQIIETYWRDVRKYTYTSWELSSKKVSKEMEKMTDSVESGTGVMENAYSRLWSIFGSGGFEAALDNMANNMRNTCNSMISYMNRLITGAQNTWNQMASLLSFSVRLPQAMSKVVGFSSMSLSMPRRYAGYNVPYLADGGFVRKNTPQLAVIGDNRHQGEVVAPEDKLREMAMEAVRAASGSGISRYELESIINAAVMRIVAAMSEMGFNIDGRQIARAQRIAQQVADIRFNTVGVTE